MSAVLEDFPLAHAAAPSPKTSLVGLTRAGLAEALAAIDVPERERRMRVSQLWQWVYFSGVSSFDAMLNVSKVLRARLAEHYTLARPEVVTEQVSSDGTRKWLIRLSPHRQDRTAHGRGSEVEVVYIPRERPWHPVHLEPGRLHPDLRLLPHRHAEAGAQPVGGRDRGAGGGRARPARRLSRAWCRPPTG